MKIKQWIPVEEQMCRLGKNHWSVARLIQLSKDFPVMQIPLDHLNVYQKYENVTLREMVSHIRAIFDADLSKPIILDEDNDLMDGRHRIMKAILNDDPYILAVRFEENPPPCRRDE